MSTGVWYAGGRGGGRKGQKEVRGAGHGPWNRDSPRDWSGPRPRPDWPSGVVTPVSGD